MADLRTVHGYDFYEATSALQKSCRRGKVKIAAFFALELYSSGYWSYVWKRLLTISAEDCYGCITQEIKSLYDSFMIINDKDRKNCPKGRVFISKAVIILCVAKHSRDADHLSNLYYDGGKYDDEEIAEFVRTLTEEERRPEIPEYTYDCHTIKGKRRGATKEQFFHDEHEALTYRQIGFFDNLVY